MILDKIAAATLQRVEELKKIQPVEIVKQQAAQMPKGNFAFRQALTGPGLHFITEVKKASPSKGLIAPHFPYVEIAQAYEAAGASALSVLTEPQFFLGSNAYLTAIKKVVNLPVLRKDFILEPYQIYEAKVIGADAILLICALLSPVQLQSYQALAEELGLSCLVEAHDQQEVEKALQAKASIIGVNNRNLHDFTVDINNSIALRRLVPPEIIFIAESGIKTRADIAVLEQAGVNGVLMGETLMRSRNVAATLAELRGR